MPPIETQVECSNLCQDIIASKPIPDDCLVIVIAVKKDRGNKKMQLGITTNRGSRNPLPLADALDEVAKALRNDPGLQSCDIADPDFDG